MTGGRAPCRRCLLEEADRKAYAQLRDYLDSLEISVRAAEETVRRRLDHCLACGNLTNGVCGLCGCFVEARAAKAALACPDDPPRWPADGPPENFVAQ